MSALHFAIPACDFTEFAALHDHCKADIRKKLELMAELRAAGRTPGKKGVVYLKWKGILGLAVSRLQSLASAFFRAYDREGLEAWRVLWDKRRWPSPEEAGNIPPKALAWMRDLCRHARVVTGARGVALRQWRAWRAGDAGQAIPGYSSCPPDGGNGYPVGWSERNWNTIDKGIAKREKTMVRLGVRAAHGQLAQVISTRVGLWVGAMIQCDDMTHDVQCFHGRQIVRPVQFGAIDVLSGCFFHHGLKPRVTREDGTVEDLNTREFRYFLADLLTSTGYSPKGTLLMLENAKTTLPEWAVRVLWDATGGLVRMEKAPMGAQPLASGYWSTQNHGNPAFKALIEKMHAFLQDQTYHLPGQVGRGLEDRPEYLHGIYAEMKPIIAAMQAGELDAAKLARLRLPLKTYAEFRDAIAEIYRWMNGRRDHVLEGWAQCGFVEQVVRHDARSEAWLSNEEMMALPADTQQAILSEVARNPRALTRERRLSPAEVFARGRAELRRLPDAAAYELLAPDYAGEDAWKAERVAATAYFVMKEAGEKTFYETRVMGKDGAWEELKQGERYRVIPFGNRAFIANRDGGFLGTAPMVTKAFPLDVEEMRNPTRLSPGPSPEIRVAMGAKLARNADILRPLREEGVAAEAGRIAEDREWNRAVLAEDGTEVRGQKSEVRSQKSDAPVDVAAVLAARPAPKPVELPEDESWT